MTAKKERKNPQELAWLAHPARERPKATILLALFLLALEVGIYFSFQSLFIALLSALFIVGSLSTYFFPTKYKLDAQGVTVKGLLFRHNRPWRQFRIYYADRRGVQLSTFLRPSRLDPFRGMSLLFSTDNREQVLAFIKERLTKAKRERLSKIKPRSIKEKAETRKEAVRKG